jgi:hypothetical protein
VIPVSLATVQFSRSAKRRRATAAWASAPDADDNAGLSKLNSMRAASGTVQKTPKPCDLPSPVDVLGPTTVEESAAELESSGGDPAGGRCPYGLPRKEVIQPQLPLRLPCYDFTPVASPTFDGSLPKGLGDRLRVLLTPMV